jgi:hypothetical protein
VNCPLCEREVLELHPNSHVVPDWMYKASFGKNAKSLFYDDVAETIHLTQSGYKASFICKVCEAGFAFDEGYARLVFGRKVDGSAIPNVSDATQGMARTQFGDVETLILRGLDFRKIQKFVLGVILKGHVAKLGVNGNLLGDKHYLRMRGIYFDDARIDDTSYPIYIHKTRETNPLKSMVSQPARTKSREGLNLIVFSGAGFAFDVSVQGHSLPTAALNIRFMKDGRLIIPIGIENPKAISQTLRKINSLKSKRWPDSKTK